MEESSSNSSGSRVSTPNIPQIPALDTQDSQDTSDPDSPKTTTSSSTHLHVRRSRKHRLHQFLDNPRSSTKAFYYAVLMFLLILACTVAFLVSSLPRYYAYSQFNLMQQIAGGIFTLDYVLRLLTADCWYRWALQPLSLVDLLVVIPFVLNLVPSINVDNQFIALRAIRLLYVLKIIKITKYVRMTRIVTHTMKKSKDGLVVLGFGIVIMCLFFSTLEFIAENTGEHFNTTDKTWYRADGSRSDFQSIFDAVWWCLVTFTTVGYGDTYPVTTLGKIVGVLTMFSGIMITALPIAIITTNFMELWREHKQYKRLTEVQAITKAAIFKPTSQLEKEVELLRIVAAIEKEERKIATSLSAAQELLHQASYSHTHLNTMLARLRTAMGSSITSRESIEMSPL